MQNSTPALAGAARSWRRAALLITSCLLGALAGCGQQPEPVAESTSNAAPMMDWEMQWAQAALERNPDLEIIAVDREARQFAVRERHSARVSEVQLGEIAAVPIPLLAPVPATPPPPPAVEQARPEEEPADSEPEPESALAATDTTTKQPTSYRSTSVIYGDGEPRERLTGPLTDTNTPYTVERSSGMVRISGPGVSIEATGQRVAANAVDSSAEIEPVICEGHRVMQLDSRTIRVDGDALTARGGCELYITNSVIVASGTGVVIDDATVHINNSRVEGRMASFDAKEQAKVFLRGSTLNGLSRRNQNALIQDQGGNRYH